VGILFAGNQWLIVGNGMKKAVSINDTDNFIAGLKRGKTDPAPEVNAV
jgi:hypothetical protein